MVAILEKTEHNTDFHRIVDFLEASHIRYALTISPTIYVSHIPQFWSTTRIETTDQETKIIATVDGKPRTISESSLRRHLKLNDEEGISSLLDAELFENLSVMGYNILPSQRENITKTSAMSHESSPRVPSFDADEGNKIKDQDIEISRLKSRVKSLEDTERRHKEPIQEDAPITRGIIDIEEELGAAKSTEKGSNDTEEMVNVLSSMEATNILSSKGTTFLTASVSPAGVFPTTGVPTVSESFPTVSAIFTTASVVTPYIRRLSELAARDSEIARIHAEEELKLMNKGLDRSNEVIAKHLSEYEQAEADLSIGEKIELINWKLYDTCGVHHVSTKKNHEIFMLVEKDYPLRKGLATVMLTSKGFTIGSAKLKGVVDRDQKLKMAKTRDDNQKNELDHSKLKSLLKAQTKEARVIKDDLKNHVSTSKLRVMPEANN
nr:poly [ADP-ribose] polymerase 1 [Tanacetum cinerariifolium]